MKKFIGYLPVLDDVSPQWGGAINCGLAMRNRQIGGCKKVRNRDFLPLIDPIPVLAGYEKLRVAEKMSRGEVYDGKKALSARE
ncbi:hypothetical protein [Pantoea trifolii]|uniref:hypothetical protein n=1 Tax=Candidatus Pantoea symbiotica TaxID=1884370 RepID=UPI0012DAB7A7|nr:hypothetical protein [Pantoea rodasii]